MQQSPQKGPAGQDGEHGSGALEQQQQQQQQQQQVVAWMMRMMSQRLYMAATQL
jgi:hypothetical protein